MPGARYHSCILSNKVNEMVTAIRVLTNDFVSIPTAAKQLGKPKVTLYRWVKAQKLIAVKFGGKWFVPVSEIERLNHGRVQTQTEEA